MIFVDTNYFLRFLLKDISHEHEKAKQLFLDGAEGKVKLFTSLLVVFEIYWVLSSIYEREKVEIIKTLKEIFDLDFIKIDDKLLMKETLEIYQRTTLDLEDSFNLVYAHSKKAEEFKTFDKKLAKQFGGRSV